MEELRREREQAEAEKVMPSEQILVRVSSGQVAIAVSRSRLEEVGFEPSVPLSAGHLRRPSLQLTVRCLLFGGSRIRTIGT